MFFDTLSQPETPTPSGDRILWDKPLIDPGQNFNTSGGFYTATADADVSMSHLVKLVEKGCQSLNKIMLPA